MRFQPGRSGNPSGRPKSAAGLRQYLEEKYGSDAGVLVERMEALATNRNPRVAFEANRLLLSYVAGKPEQHLAVSGQFEHARLVPLTEDALARLTQEELAVLLRLSANDSAIDAEPPEEPLCRNLIAAPTPATPKPAKRRSESRRTSGGS